MLSDVARLGRLVGAVAFWGREFVPLDEFMVKLGSRGVQIKVFNLRCSSLGVGVWVLRGSLVSIL
jgi:hypothetical protein